MNLIIKAKQSFIFPFVRVESNVLFSLYCLYYLLKAEIHFM